MDFRKSVAVIMPCVDPDDKFLSTVWSIASQGFENIIVVDDGSEEEKLGYFKKAQNIPGCKVLTHGVNLGKGRALKTAFNFVLTQCPDLTYAVTIDSDGQHSIKDVEKCCGAIDENKDSLILGVRDFKNRNDNVPFRSKLGNVFTRKALQLFCDIDISDTQTGLRVFPRDLMKEFLKVPGERFEYEMNMLLRARENGISIKEIPIKTIYIEENKASHFNPLTDSLRIYATISKFIISSVASFVVDILVFSLLSYFLFDKVPYYLIVSSYLARLLSSLFNYSVNKSTVFKNRSKNASTLVKYSILCVSQITASAVVTQILFNLVHINATAIKIIVDFALFLVSFKIQGGWVFR